jgi:hypothetical protein
MRIKSIIVLVLSTVLIGAFDTIAEMITLTPDKTLSIDFYIPQVQSPVPDRLELLFGMVEANRYTFINGLLYNGQQFLGLDIEDLFGGSTGPLSLSPALTWVSPESEYRLGYTGVIDFTSIRNATINGRIDLTIQTGSITLDLANVNLITLETTDLGDYICMPQPVVTSRTIIPEPITLLLLGLGTMIAARRR